MEFDADDAFRQACLARDEFRDKYLPFGSELYRHYNDRLVAIKMSGVEGNMKFDVSTMEEDAIIDKMLRMQAAVDKAYEALFPEPTLST